MALGRRAQKVGVEPDTRAHATNLSAAAEARVHRHRVIRVPRNHKDRNNDRPAVKLKLDRGVRLKAQPLL